MQSMITMKSLLLNSGFSVMASITIRNLDDDVKARLRLAAARHECSMEEEARRILRHALLVHESERGLGTRIHERFTKVGGFELPEFSRSDFRPSPFEDETDE
jgi:plasmid stability protein